MTSKLKRALGAVKDQTSIRLAKVSAKDSSNLDVTILKATTHDDVPMEERYVQEILALVSSDKSHAATCARAIGRRIGRTRNWIVAIKSLILVLRLFQDGDPYFPREVLHAMKRGAKILNLSGFRDDSNSGPWDYTAFVRTFALYLDERLDCFLTGKLQRRYTNQDREPFWKGNESVRNMKPAMLLDKILYWQRLLERAVATRPTGSARANRLVHTALHAVVQETFDLYRDISDGLALVLDSFFHLQYNNCVNAFQACVKATKQFEELSAFYDVCKSVGVGRTSEYPSVQKISDELIETLQEFLKDQTSFPTRSPPSRRMLLPPPETAAAAAVVSTSGRWSQSNYDRPSSEQYSDSGTRSLEDLISATEYLTANSPSISIDLEAYSIADQSEKQAQVDGSECANDETGSTRSLPVSNSLVDLVSFGDWPEQEQEIEKVIDDDDQKQQQPLPPVETNSATGWELVLAETAPPPPSTSTEAAFDNGGDIFSSLEQEEKRPSESGSVPGWELILAETASPPLTQQPAITTTPFYTIDSVYRQSPAPPTHYYNPFLHDETELTAPPTVTTAARETFEVAEGGFSVAPTFQATPTFSAQNGNSVSVDWEKEEEEDPFGFYPIGGDGEEGLSDGSTNQQNLQQQQQLWVQQQNKIIARHMEA